MKFKFVQTRTVRYSVVIEAPDMNAADDAVHHHEEWWEERVEESDPPWREDCPEDANPDVYVVAGRILPACEYLDPIKSIPDCNGTHFSVGARVMYQRGSWEGAPWFPGTVKFLNYDYDDSYALVEDDDKTIKYAKNGTWLKGVHVRVIP